MILSVVFSKPTSDCESLLGRAYKRVKAQKSYFGTQDSRYMVELFTETQVFHQTMSEPELESFFKKYMGLAFKSAVKRTESEEITFLTNRHGKLTELHHPLQSETKLKNIALCGGNNKVKKYLLPEGKSIPFLVALGIMTDSGKVISQKQDKFRQINRFLECVNDILPDVLESAENPDGKSINIVDFGCGKSYLTFAVYYYLSEIKKINAHIVGIDLKADVIRGCQKLANECGFKNMEFVVGNVENFSQSKNPDLVLTLHACDTATDYALSYAVKKNAKAILSVPCCQHEVNEQLKKQDFSSENPFATFNKWGLLRERFSALVTDGLRAELLEQNEYAVQVLEFTDASSTPKNLMIRAVKRKQKNAHTQAEAKKRSAALMDALSILPSLQTLLQD